MSRIQRKINSASGQLPIGTPGRRRHRNRVATGGQELSDDEYTVPFDYSSPDWSPTTDTSEEPEGESASSTNEPSTPPGSWRSILTIPLMIVIVGCVLGRIVAGAAAFATMILLITVGGVGAASLVYWLWKFINGMVRSSHKT